MSNLVTDLLPWLLLLQQVVHPVSARGFSPGGTEVSKGRLRASRQQHESTPEDITLVDTLVTTDNLDAEYWYRRMFDVELTPKELACARNGTILYPETQQCHWLLEQGPCAPSEWLVLPGGGSERPVCRPRPCAPRHTFLSGEQPPRCAPLDALCAQRPDRELRFSLRGEARCQCKGFRAQGPDGRCHVLYAQGACPSGQVLVPAFNRSVGGCVAACQPAACAEGEVQMEAPEEGDEGDEGVRAGTHCAEFAELECASQVVPLFTLDVDIQMLMPFLDSSLDTSVGICVPNLCAEDHMPVFSEDTKETTCMLRSAMTCVPYFLRLFDTLVGPKVPVCDSSERNSIGVPAHKTSCIPDNTGACSSSRQRYYAFLKHFLAPFADPLKSLRLLYISGHSSLFSIFLLYLHIPIVS